MVTSTFGSKLTALKNTVKIVKALRYKLRMFGFPIEGPTNVYCDNESAYKNMSTPQSVLKKKHHSISYHRCREAVAASTICISKEPTATNLSGLFTNMLPQFVRENLIDWFTYYMIFISPRFPTGCQFCPWYINIIAIY